MKKIMILSSFFMFAVTSCSTKQVRTCNSENAYSKGRGDAESWIPARPSDSGHICHDYQEFNSTQFEEKYNSAYRERMNLQCSESFLSSKASENAINFDFSFASKLSVCPNANSKKYYESIFVKQMCSVENFSNYGTKHGSSLVVASYESVIGNCSSNKTKLISAYQNAYKAGLNSACQAANVTTRAQKDVRSKIELASGLNQLNLCPEATRQTAITVYSVAFSNEQSKIEREEQEKRIQESLRQQKLLASKEQVALADGKVAYSFCEVRENKAYVQVFSEGNETTNLYNSNEKYVWYFFNDKGLQLSREEKSEYFFLSQGKINSDLVYDYIPYGTVTCRFKSI